MNLWKINLNLLEPIWQPIRNLPIIANLIEGQLADAKEQHTRLLKACPKSHVLDVALVQRIIHVFTDQLEFAWVFEKQLSKWMTEERLTPIQQSEIDRLARTGAKVTQYSDRHFNSGGKFEKGNH